MSQTINLETTWWQTGLHIVISIALFVPAIFIFGIITWLYQFFFLSPAGTVPNGGALMARGIQYGAGTYFCLALPTFLIKRSNIAVLTSVFGTILAIFHVVILLQAYYGSRAVGWFTWLELGVCVIGSVIGVLLVYAHRDDMLFG
jgi:hypothetical protein